MNFLKSLERVSTRHTLTSVFSDFVRIAACCVAVGTREREYLETIKRYDRDEIEHFRTAFHALIDEMEKRPFRDLLGPAHMEIGSKVSHQHLGEFYTPQEVSELIASVTIDVEGQIKSGKAFTVQEPACGSGGMILSLAKLFAPKGPGEPSHVDLIRCQAIDVNRLACDMTYINTTLWGIPCDVVHGNALSLQVFGRWKNFHWFRVGGRPVEPEPEPATDLKAFTDPRLAEPWPEPEPAPPPPITPGPKLVQSFLF